MKKDGVLQSEGGRHLLRFERSLRHPPERVWRGLTEAGELEHWFPAQIQGERRLGAALRFVFAGDESLPVETGEITAFDPPREFAFTWGEETLRWELQPQGSGTLLILTASFADRVKAPRDASGWHGCLDALEDRLGGRARTQLSADGWAALYRRYVDAIGLGDFPGFAQHPAQRAEAPAGLQGQLFEGADGRQIALWVASADVELPEALHALEHVIVLEGSYSFRINEQDVVVGAGQEFTVPPGARFAARYRAGTRTVQLYGEPAVKRA